MTSVIALRLAAVSDESLPRFVVRTLSPEKQGSGKNRGQCGLSSFTMMS
jgi:hypothetical protein